MITFIVKDVSTVDVAQLLEIQAKVLKFSLKLLISSRLKSGSLTNAYANCSSHHTLMNMVSL